MNNFTNKQKEAILEAVSNFISFDGNTYETAKEVNDVFIGYLQQQCNEAPEVSSERTSRVLFTGQRINDFLHDIQEAINSPELKKVA